MDNNSLYGCFSIIMFFSRKLSLCFLLCIFPITSDNSLFPYYHLITGKELMERSELDDSKWGLLIKKLLLEKVFTTSLRLGDHLRKQAQKRVPSKLVNFFCAE